MKEQLMAGPNGIDVTKVFIPVTGHMGVAPEGTTIPTPAQGGAPDFKLAPAFKMPGLLAEDGGFEWTLEKDGDAIVFYQEGFSLPSGLANATVVVKLAQTDDIVRSIIHGQTPDENGYLEIDAGGTDAVYVLYTEEIAKNLWIRRHIAAIATIDSVKEDKSTRGEVVGYEVTFKIARSPRLNNRHIGEWLIPPTNDAAPAAASTSGE
jgi:hypothetical protein